MSQTLCVRTDGLVPALKDPDSPFIFTREEVQPFLAITVKSS